MPKVPDAQHCTVRDDKITLYLLKFLPKDDKSKFLIGYGFSMQYWPLLVAALRDHINRLDGVVTRKTPNGQIYKVNYNIQTPDGRNPCVNTYWEIIPGLPPNFVTLIP
jgi:hypothetical protein